MEVDDQKLRVTFIDRKGNRHYDRASKDRLVAASLEPGASVAQLALEHGVNANLLWKWIQKHKSAQQEAQESSVPSPPAFIPVRIASSAAGAVLTQGNARALDLRCDNPGLKLAEPDRLVALSSSAKVSASLPNGVKLTLECDDVRAVTAIIGALSNVQIGR